MLESEGAGGQSWRPGRRGSRNRGTRHGFRRHENRLFPLQCIALTDEAKTTLGNNAAWLSANAQVAVIIEGHCDQRGSTEYNLALGEKRAQEVRKYLSNLGVNQDRLSVVSYGEEQLADYGETEAAFDRNRRAEFRVAE